MKNIICILKILLTVFKKKDEYDNKYIDEFTYQLNVSDLCSYFNNYSNSKNLNKIAEELGVECIPCKDDRGTQYCDNFGSKGEQENAKKIFADH